mmetsp:Transcript_43220/g.135103  ORF Transcript_43220/g.135103 Transcript_43220/m.135103 type:complete len:369 (+) Transcript_43220:805-1911(+)
MAHLLEVVQTDDSSLQLCGDVQVFQGARHERHVLLVPDVQCELQRLLPDHRGDQDRDDDHPHGAEHRDENQRPDAVLSRTPVAERVVQGACHHVDGLHQCHQVEAQVACAIELVAAELQQRRTVTEREELIAVPPAPEEEAGHPMRAAKEEEEHPTKAHDAVALEEPHRVRQTHPVHHTHELDIVEDEGQVEEKHPQIGGCAQPLDVVEGAQQPPHEDLLTTRHLHAALGMHEGHVELQEQVAGVDQVHHHIDADQCPEVNEGASVAQGAAPGVAAREGQRRDHKRAEHTEEHHHRCILGPLVGEAADDAGADAFLLFVQLLVIDGNDSALLQEPRRGVMMLDVVELGLDVLDGVEGLAGVAREQLGN